MALPKKRKSILESFLEAVSGFTGMHICVYDLAYFTRDDEKLNIPAALREHRSPFCLKVKSDKAGWKRCIKDEYFRAAEAQKKNAPFLHTCHAGLTDLVVPIRRGGEQIGAIYLGQTVTVGVTKAAKYAHDLSQTYDLSEPELRKLQGAQPNISNRRLKGHSDLLNGLRDYIEIAEKLIGREQVGHGFLRSAGRDAINMQSVPTFFLDQLEVQSDAISKAVRLIKQRYWKQVSLADVAREVGFSESHFTREFQRETGYTFRKCLVETRINAALYLLKRSDLNVGEIAEMIGYEDVSSMGRAFRKQVGASPKQFLRMQPPPWLVDDISKTHFAERQEIPI